MNKKFFKESGTIFTIFAFANLFFPWIRGFFKEEMVSTGFGLIEFSVWGVICVILPVLLLTTAYSALEGKVKALTLTALFLLGNIAFYFAVSSGVAWFREISASYVRLEWHCLLYPIFLILSFISFSFSSNKKECEDDYLYLCSRPFSFTAFNEDETASPYTGCVSFVTEDGLFTTINQSEKNTPAKNSEIELSEKGETVGYVTQTRTFVALGSFYEKYDFSKEMKIKIASFGEIEDGKAELWLDKDGTFTKIPSRIKPDFPTSIAMKLRDKIPHDITGAVVVQNGCAVAVVSSYDAENDTYNCVSAKTIAIPLFAAEYEQKLFANESKHIA